MLPVALIHGGLYDPMGPEQFWGATGVLDSLAASGLEVIALQRPRRPASWIEEAQALAGPLGAGGSVRYVVIGASNGCSAALRLALDHPHVVERLMLCWPATAGDEVLDELARVIITDEADERAASELLAGHPVRGCTPDELASIQVPTVIWPSMPENKLHQRKTAMELVGAIPDAMILSGGPEPTSDDFDAFRGSFVTVVTELATVHPDD